jgi:predicted MPP superfamily phosphohydrolase
MKNSVTLARIRALLIPSLVFLLLFIANKQALEPPIIIETDIPMSKLPLKLDGFRVVQLSDLHIGPTVSLDQVKRVVKMTNELNADIITLTGDFCDGSAVKLKHILQPLGELKSKYGIYFVTGNHE